jgi:hypothetical protein
VAGSGIALFVLCWHGASFTCVAVMQTDNGKCDDRGMLRIAWLVTDSVSRDDAQCKKNRSLSEVNNRPGSQEVPAFYETLS